MIGSPPPAPHKLQDSLEDCKKVTNPLLNTSLLLVEMPKPELSMFGHKARVPKIH
jgi:hypothetical protein